MNIGVFGSGMVGQALSARLAGLGHAVMVGTRDVGRLLARTEPDGYGNPSFADWHAEHPDIQVGTFAEAAAHGALLVNATNGGASLEALGLAGAVNLSGKVLVDIANPLDFSQGMPPSLFVANTDSLAEQIQRAFPDVKVVKTLNTLTAALMVEPERLAGGDHTVFLSGNDAGAKSEVAALLRSFGWRDILDLGDITSARGTEMLLPLWLRAWGALGTGLFNVRVVR
jgi:hypothetical protein